MVAGFGGVLALLGAFGLGFGSGSDFGVKEYKSTAASATCSCLFVL